MTDQVQEFARRFKEKNGSIVCRELLEGVEVEPGKLDMCWCKSGIMVQGNALSNRKGRSYKI